MKNFFIIILVFLILIEAFSQKLHRISSEKTQKSQMKADDQIVSALGYFKIQLDGKTCQLGIYQFSEIERKYLFVDSYQNNQTTNCKSIKIDNNRIITDSGIELVKFSSSDFQRTWMSIDDQGTIRFIGVKNTTYQSSIPVSDQIVLKAISSALQNNKNIFSNSQYKLGQISKNYTNLKKWNFKISNNTLSISKEQNLNYSKSFSLQNINLDRSGIYDLNSKTSPFIFFENALLYPRCNIRKEACQIKSPYTLQFNSYWPVVRIYDQQKYLIASYEFGQQNNLKKNHICPPGSFLMGQLCVKQCPSPYYENIDGRYGECQINCQQGSIINQDSKTCSCSVKDLQANPQDKKMIKKCQKQWSVNFYGCDCSAIGKVYDRLNSLSCETNCSLMSFTDSGVCYSCPEYCATCTRDNNFIKYLKCQSCMTGYKIINDLCVQDVKNCSQNCQQCNGIKCTKCFDFYSLYEGNCIVSCPPGFYETYQQPKKSYCVPNSTPQNKICPIGCIKCDNQICLACALGYILFISPLAATCKLKTSFLTCPSNFKYEAVRQICYIDNIDEFNMGKCKNNIQYCQTCKTNFDSICILCEEGFFLLNNKCVQKCPSGYLKLNNVCVEQIKDCQSEGTILFSQQQNINFDLMKSSQAYKRQIFNGLEPSNDPAGYQIYFKQFILQESTNNKNYSTLAHSTQNVCLKCRRGYGLSDDKTQCIPCPKDCQYQYCYFARSNSCYKPTVKCTYLDENDNCMESCPQGRFPQVDSKNQTRCLLSTQSSVNDYLKVDSSYYIQDDGSKIYYFVLDKPVQNASVILSTSRLLSHGKVSERMLIQSEDVISLQQGQYYGIRNTNQNAVAINFDQSVNKFRTPFGFTLANSVYGAQADYTHNQWMKQWLAHIGFILSWVILIIHCLYIGNTILYKVDNLIIFCQTIYLFTFVKLLVGNTLAQYYYGWFWMHMGFFPNYFKHTVPSQYEEKQAPISFKLATLDGNFIRNAGFAVSLFLTFLAAWIIICLIVFLLNKLLKKNDIWYNRIAKNSLIAAIQLLSMIVFFFSVTQLIYGGQFPESQKSFHRANFAASIFFVTLISIYMFLRFFFDKIGGLYMFKRLAIALILVNAYLVEGFLALLIALEIVVLLIRYVLEKPRLLRQKIFMLSETLCFILAYILLFLVLVPGVNVLIITIIIFAMLLFLIADMMDVYLQSRNQFYKFDFLGAKYDNQQKNNEDDAPDSERKMNQ